jgi:hypothetical protein
MESWRIEDADGSAGDFGFGNLLSCALLFFRRVFFWVWLIRKPKIWCLFIDASGGE